MKPTIGRIVIFNEGTETSPDFPAIIVRVFSDTCVNLHVFRDDGGSSLRTSVLLAVPGQEQTGMNWRWPNRE